MDDPTKPTPLPIRQLLLTALIVFTEPMGLVFLFPFVYFMVEGFEVAANDDQIGLYVGILSASFPAAQVITSLLWGLLSDKIGRKPVLLLGAFGGGICMLGFGFSTNYWMALAFRTTGGLLNGNLGVAKTVTGEITDSSNRSKGFSVIGFVTGFGFIVAPVVGGFLSNPAEAYPALFGGSAFFIKFPYLLPCAVVAFISIGASVTGFFFFKETLKKEDKSDSATDVLPKASPRQVLMNPFVISCISLYGIVAFSTILFDEVFAIWAVEDVDDRGLNFTSGQVGALLTFGGIVLLLTQLFLYPRFAKIVPPLEAYMLGILACAPLLISFPLLQYIAVKQEQAIANEQSGTMHEIILWILLLLIVTIRVMLSTASFTSSMIVVSNCVFPEHLGAANGLGQMVASALRALGPFLAGSLWTWTLTNGLPFPFNQYFVFILAAVVCVVGFMVAFAIPKRANFPPVRVGHNAPLLASVDEEIVPVYGAAH